MANQTKQHYTPISPLTIRPDFQGNFEIYLRHDNSYVLFNGQGRKLSKDKRQELLNNITKLYIATRDIELYRHYLTEHIRALLEDESIPLDDRAKAWTNTAIAMGRELFEKNLPGPAFANRYKRFESLLQNSSGFMQSPDSLRHLSQFMGKGYDTYHHGISTMVYTVNLLQEYRSSDYETLACGMGALLHDIGKTELPRDITAANPAALSPDDHTILALHPMLGVRACSYFNLPVIASNCILFHHERPDGKGYPTMATKDDLPLEVKAVALCNVYDNFTRTLPYRRALAPFDALKRIMDTPGLAEPDMLKRLIKLLSKAKIV
jgi:HD-GYP domain-containing protein (c-di-GMP phosphodiesterase class II)